MKGKEIWKRVLAGALTAGLLMNSVPVCAAEDADGAMGRYLEQDVALPEQLGKGIGVDMVRTQDGVLRLGVSNKETDVLEFWDSKDGGASWELSAALPEAYREFYLMDLALCADGGGAAVGMIQKGLWGEGGGESEASWEEASTSMDDYEYYFLSFDGEGKVQETLLEEGFGIGSLAFSRGGQLIATSYSGKCMVLDRTTGEVLSELAADGTQRIAACGGEAILLKESELWRFDLESGEPLERDQALEDALYAGGVSYEVTTTMGSPIVFAEDEEGRLYYCTENGIYSHTMGGSTVEQVVDGSLNTLSDPTLTRVALEVVDGVFYLLCVDGNGDLQVMKYVYDASVSSVPQRELTVYSLQENQGIRQAAVAFQKMYPDIYVNYQVGMSGGDGVTASDALRTLNTDILAGNGPDILIMDGMSVDTYAGKGMLRDLSGIVEELQEKDGVMEKIAYTWQTESGLAAVPVRFALPLTAGETEIVDSVEGVASLVELAAEPGVMAWTDGAQIAEILYYICAGSWKQEDGTLNQELLTEYVDSAKKIFDACMEQADDEVKPYVTEYWEYLREDLGAYSGSLNSALSLLDGTCRIETGMLLTINQYCGLTSVNREVGNCKSRLLNGQQSNVFLPICTVGLMNTAREPEAAEDFVKYLLSQEGETANASVGFPVNRAALQQVLYTNQYGEEGSGYVVSSSYSDGSGYVELEYTWPSTEELDALMEIMEGLSQRSDVERVQQDVVLEETHRCINGEIGVEEAVNSIMQKMNLYLAEN